MKGGPTFLREPEAEEAAAILGRKPARMEALSTASRGDLHDIVMAAIRVAIGDLRDEIAAIVRDAMSAGGPSRRLNVAEAAEFLGISIATLRRHVKSGKVPSLHVGRRFAFDESALRKLSGAAAGDELE